MEKSQVNPWTWQDMRQFSQAWRVDDPRSTVFVAGQGPIDENGQVVGTGDFEAQVRQVFANLRTVLERSGASFADVVKFTVYLTDMSKLPEFTRVKAEFVTGKQPASTAIGVAALAIREMQVEVDAIAVL